VIPGSYRSPLPVPQGFLDSQAEFPCNAIFPGCLGPLFTLGQNKARGILLSVTSAVTALSSVGQHNPGR